ncbi:helix-turn-helix domain-containing protein [Actinokineospora terrae]|uniref:Helix-turn-helix domain-containing protein n=1 Tax=Actinokineospora terrae TaxID=155974 RepID=A0A1H9XE64_9PSEU|nr:helix-turn-helix transcriptional regulator [Actinokineospora terrae]SES44486.1 Helix-turn-helix domain-containing protein [Actinokineospora terrae]
MAKGAATMPRVFLGVALAQLRSDAGISLEAAAKHVGKPRQRLMNLLEGRATFTAEELTTLAKYLGATGDRLSELESLGAEARKSPTGDPYTDLGPESWRRVAYLEAKAESIQAYENGVFPALVQSVGYAEALIRATEGVWQDELDDQVRAGRAAFRLKRQQLVFDSAEPKRISLFFTEDTFNAGVGSPQVMVEQCQYILDLVSAHENLDVRIIPTSTWDNPAQNGGFVLFGFGELLRPIGFMPVIYGPSTYMDSSEDTERMARAFARLGDLALSRDDSLKLVSTNRERFHK